MTLTVTLRSLDAFFAQTSSLVVGQGGATCTIGTTPASDIVLPSTAFRTLGRRVLKVTLTPRGELAFSHLGLRGGCKLNGVVTEDTRLAAGVYALELAGRAFELTVAAH
jgi:hypothetical protein